uniref:Putative secreted protein n=1 Tax=Amblyomma triste TaxID=251400 RepID=A0A023G1Y2_AMBTT
MKTTTLPAVALHLTIMNILLAAGFPMSPFQEFCALPSYTRNDLVECLAEKSVEMKKILDDQGKSVDVLSAEICGSGIDFPWYILTLLTQGSLWFSIQDCMIEVQREGL